MKDENAFIKEMTQRRFGYEIEVNFDESPDRDSAIEKIARRYEVLDDHDDYLDTRRDNSFYHIKHDGSLSGEYAIEISTPPYSKDTVGELADIVAIVKSYGGYVDTSCGLHTHIDAHNLSDKGFVMLYRFYRGQQKNLNWFFPPGRRADRDHENGYCEALPRVYLTSLQDIKDELIENVGGHRVINFSSYAVRGTIEFRQHSGSLNYTKMLSWAVFLQSLVEWADKTTDGVVEWSPTDCYYGPLMDVGWFKNGVGWNIVRARDFYLRRLKHFIPSITFAELPANILVGDGSEDVVEGVAINEWIQTDAGLQPA